MSNCESFADMGVQPATLQTTLWQQRNQQDNIAPASTITAPSNGASFLQDLPLLFLVLLLDAAIVAGVENFSRQRRQLRPVTTM